jgi:hypothetical protein
MSIGHCCERGVAHFTSVMGKRKRCDEKEASIVLMTGDLDVLDDTILADLEQRLKVARRNRSLNACGAT